MENKEENKPIEQKEATPAQVEVKQEAAPIEENQQEKDWKKYKEARRIEREKLQQEAEMQRKTASEERARADALKAAMEALVNKPQVQSEENLDIDEDKRIEEKVMRYVAKKEQENEEKRRKQEQNELPQRLQQIHNDFYNVCSQENLDYFEYHYPEVASAFRNQPESMDKWINLYKTVKRFMPNADTKKDQAKIDKNLSKPQSMSIPGKTPTGDSAPMTLNDQRKKDNWSRMMKVMRNG